ncbi:MAG: phosphate uptake regulator PhoU [Candidatus Heimdallarchaeota archaeon]|nr:phosphate uptake regulator PhoU [Candidatus Heimdallarchaeota archaeon]
MVRVSLEDSINEIFTGIQKLLDTVEINLEAFEEAFSSSNKDEFDAKMEFSKARTNDLTIRSLGEALEGKTVKTLSLQAPVGRDLRLVISSFRMIYDIQRISRDALNAFKDILDIKGEDLNEFELKQINIFSEVVNKGKQLIEIFKQIYGANMREHQNFNELIIQSINLDNEIDDIFDQIMNDIMNNKDINLRTGVLILSANRSLERYGDHACNMIERAIYIQTGEKVEIK